MVKLGEHLLEQPRKDSHDIDFQVTRRKHLAKARNRLLFAGLRDEKWVLWLDVDLRYIPPDLVQQLIAVQKHIVVPSCVYVQENGNVDIYDRNTWKETNRSLAYQADKDKGYVMLEGYGESMRDNLLNFRPEGHMYVDVDGVGGTALLVYADCHRRGLIFPPFPYSHHLETEALGKMARDMGFEVVGLPFLEVFHA